MPDDPGLNIEAACAGFLSELSQPSIRQLKVQRYLFYIKRY
jgi:hypothetical protein